VRVTGTRSDKDIEFRVARPADLDEVLGLLDEAAAWLRGKGVIQWPDRFEPSWVEGAIGRGETWLVAVEGQVSGTVTVDWSDSLWDDTDGDAAYVHRLTVRRQAAGLGPVILAWAADLARQHGRHVLRLDCVASNERLRAYYEAAGFVYRDDVGVGGAPGQRLDSGPKVLVSRYERKLC
jgi:GNAT superfamily N-acetyltransferase